MPAAEPGRGGGAQHDQADALEAVIDRYLEDAAAGRAPDPEATIRAHPELADTLRGIFRTLEFIEATGRTLESQGLGRGQRLGDFRILGEVGRGGMGVVYEAIQESLGRRVALKVLPAGALLGENAGERFAREAATAARLHHTNIVPVFAVGEERGVRYFAMQFIQGRSLAELIQARAQSEVPPGREWFARVAGVGLQAAEALGHAHEQGVIHRDVKPANLLIDANDHVWLTDFGLARAAALATITMSGDVVGTARYMSPEQVRGGRGTVDARTDVYALGVTLYEMAALVPACGGESRDDVLNRITGAGPAPIRRVIPAIPRDLANVIMKCVDAEPARRYASAAELARDLRRHLEGRPVAARRPSVLRRAGRFLSRHRLHAAGSAVTLVLACVSLALILELRGIQGESRLDEALEWILIEPDSERAARLLDEAARLGVEPARLALYRGLVPLLSGRPAAALADLESAWAAAPRDAVVYHALAFAALAAGDAARGLDLLDAASRPPPDTALGWLFQGYALAAAGREGEAAAAYDRAVSLAHDFTPAIEARAHVRAALLLERGEQELLPLMLSDFDALALFRPASGRAHSLSAIGHWTAAAALRQSGDLEGAAAQLDEARRAFERALTLRGFADSGVLARYGAFLRFTGDFAGSEQLLANAVASERGAAAARPGHVHQLALARHALGRPGAALEALENAWSGAVCPLPVRLHQVLLLAELGRLDEARAASQVALEAARGDPRDERLARGIATLVGTGQAGGGLTGGEPAETAVASARGALPVERSMEAFLCALERLAAGDREAGRQALERCLGAGVFSSLEHRLAQVFQARMVEDPAWPSWVPGCRDDE